MESITECKSISEIRNKLLPAILFDQVKESCEYKYPLEFCVKNKRHLAAKYYIENDIVKVDKNILTLSASCDNLEILEFLYARFPDLFTGFMHELMSACITINPSFEILEFLLEHGADINSNDSLYLWTAVFDKNLELVKWLISRGAKITESILVTSIQPKSNFDVEIFELLLTYNNIPKLSFRESYVLRCAIKHCNFETIELILKKMETQNCIDKAVLNSILMNRLYSSEIVGLMLKFGADASPDALACARRYQYRKTFEVLKEYGGSEKCCVIC